MSDHQKRPAGVFAAALTPLDDNLEPDHAAFTEHCRWLLANGCDGLGVLGTTGEANGLPVASRLALIAHACATLAPEKLLIGTGSCALADAVALTRASLAGGARHVLVLPPFYYKPATEDGMFRFFAALIERVAAPELRLYLYNFPQLTGYNFPISLIRRLRHEFRSVIAGAKDSSGNWDNMAAMCRELEDFDVFAGTEVYLLDILRAGGAGCISATANVTAPLCQAIYGAHKAVDGAADEVQARLTKIRRVLEGYPVIPALKALTGRRDAGPGWEHVLPPFAALDDGRLAQLETALAALGFVC